MSARSIILVIVVAALWGGNFIAVKVSTEDFPPIFLLTLRFALVAALALPFAKRPSRESLLPILAVSIVLGGLHFSLVFTGISRIEASTAAIAAQLGPPFSTLLAVLLFRESMGWRRVVGIAVAFSGVAVLAGAPQVADDAFGLGLVVAGAFAWAVANNLIKRLGPFDPLMLTAWMALFAVPQLLVVSLLLESGQWESLQQAAWPAWAGVVYTSVGSTILAYGIWYSLINTSDVSRLAPFTLLAPVFAVFAAVVLLGEALTLPLVGGALLTILGVALCEIRFSAWRRRRRRKLELE